MYKNINRDDDKESMHRLKSGIGNIKKKFNIDKARNNGVPGVNILGGRFSITLTNIKTRFTRVFSSIYSNRSYAFTKLFWGRGKAYRLIALISITIPLSFAGFTIYMHSIDIPAKPSNVIFTKAAINQAIKNNESNFKVEGKLMDSAETVAQTNTSIISWYSVSNGDTLDTISKKYHISKDSIMWSNHMISENIHIGQILDIIPVDGTIYTTKSNDTIDSIAQTYSVSSTQIIAWNLLDSSAALAGGKRLLIPGATQNSNNIINAIDIKLPNSQVIIGASNCPLVDSSTPVSWCYLQTDPRWSSLIMGGSGASNKYSYINLGNAGCLVTAVAMVSTYYGYKYTPASIAVNPSLFAYGGLLTMSGLGKFNVIPLGFGSGGVSWGEIDKQVSKGHPVIVGSYYINHYVVVYQKNADGTYLAADPARGIIKLNRIFKPSLATEAFLYLPYNQQP